MIVSHLLVVLKNITKLVALCNLIKTPYDQHQEAREQSVSHQTLRDKEPKKARVLAEDDHVLISWDKSTVCECGDSQKHRESER